MNEGGILKHGFVNMPFWLRVMAGQVKGDLSITPQLVNPATGSTHTATDTTGQVQLQKREGKVEEINQCSVPYLM